MIEPAVSTAEIGSSCPISVVRDCVTENQVGNTIGSHKNALYTVVHKHVSSDDAVLIFLNIIPTAHSLSMQSVTSTSFALAK